MIFYFLSVLTCVTLVNNSDDVTMMAATQLHHEVFGAVNRWFAGRASENETNLTEAIAQVEPCAKFCNGLLPISPKGGMILRPAQLDAGLFFQNKRYTLSSKKVGGVRHLRLTIKLHSAVGLVRWRKWQRLRVVHRVI